jgi:hypothetical protein
MPDAKSKIDLAAELSRELHSLRSNFESIIEKYSLNVKSQIEEMVQKLDMKKQPANEKIPLPKRKNIEKMISKIQKLKIKPEKGRQKDVRRIQGILDELSSIFS